MENTIFIENRFSSLIKNDFTGLSSYSHINIENTHLFILGQIYNLTNEKILTNYIEQGINSFKEIDGNFIIFIVSDNKVIVFRDRHGSGKQFFYSNDIWTTNLIDFTSISGFTCTPNLKAIFTFLSIGYIPSPLTSLEGVQKLSAGCILSYEDNTTTTLDLYNFQDFLQSSGTTKLTIEEATTEYERLHKKSIIDRIKDADKVGLLLSGGYDSGNISALRDIYNGNVVSYSIGFKNNQWTELPLAKILSEKYQSKHYEYEINGSEIMNLPQIVKAFGDPFQENGLMVNYTAMKTVTESNENPNVILGGDGNDQHFGTFGKELALNWKFKNNGIQIFQKLIDTLGNGSMFENDNIFFRSQFHNRKILHILQCDTFGFTKYHLNKMTIQGNKIPEYKYINNIPSPISDYDQLYLSRNFLVDIKQIINEVILFKASKMADMFSNNLTFPYMSTDLYNFLKQLPVNYKFNGTLDEISKGKGKAKFLHKSYLKPKLPSEITDRKKQGGFAPLPLFLQEADQRKIIFDIIEKSDAISTIFNKQEIHKFLLQYNKIADIQGYWFWYKQVQANKIINLLTIVIWWEIYINKKKGNRVEDFS